MGLYLIYCWDDVAGTDEGLILSFIKIRNTNRSDLSCLIGFFKRLIHFQRIFIGLMDQEQVDIIGLQFIQRLLDARPSFLVAGAGAVQLCGEKNVLPGQAALLNGLTHNILIVIHLGSVNQAIAQIQCSQDGFFASLTPHIPGAKANHRQLYSVV